MHEPEPTEIRIASEWTGPEATLAWSVPTLLGMLTIGAWFQSPFLAAGLGLVFAATLWFLSSTDLSTDLVITRGRFRQLGPLARDLPIGEGLSLHGCIGDRVELRLNGTVLEKFSGDWDRATSQAEAIARVSDVPLDDRRVGDPAAYAAADVATRQVLRIEALALQGLEGKSFTPRQPNVLEADHDHLVFEVGRQVLVSTRRSFRIGDISYPVQPGMVVRAVPQRVLGSEPTSPASWAVSLGCTCAGVTFFTTPVQVDGVGLQGMLWFAEHLERNALPLEAEGDETEVPQVLRALRKGTHDG